MTAIPVHLQVFPLSSHLKLWFCLRLPSLHAVVHPESSLGQINLFSVASWGGPGRRKGSVERLALAADVSKPEDVQRMVDAIVARWGTVHVACNNAGINLNSASEETSLEEWDKTFNVNLRGLFLCCQVSVKYCTVPHPQKQLAYNTSKAGVVKLTQTLGTEGIVDTPLIHSQELRPLVRRWLADIPAGRLAQPTDLQAAVVYLASEASDYMTGHNLVIEGGQSLW
uniref:Uncharacterized protein n=1 Tax=Geospiza parvula TaxID=87175 RepID=A0A8C3QBU7_GEOPR